jgi:hypothetical protein
MGAVRKRAVFWVAVLKRDHVPPVKDAIHPHPKNGAFWHMVVKGIFFQLLITVNPPLQRATPFFPEILRICSVFS